MVAALGNDNYAEYASRLQGSERSLQTHGDTLFLVVGCFNIALRGSYICLHMFLSEF